MRYALWLLVGCAALTVGSVVVGWVGTPEDSNRRYPAMRFDFPPITKPELVSADDAKLADDQIVIGVIVDGEPRAYVRDAFVLDPRRHVVLDSVRYRQIAITYCDRRLCSRVLTGTEPGQPLNLSIGGWREDQTLELIVNERRFSHLAADIPLVDLPHFMFAWGLWKRQHPDTLVYLGNLAAEAIVPVN